MDDEASILHNRLFWYDQKHWPTIQHAIVYRMLTELCEWTERATYIYVTGIVGNDVLLATNLAGMILTRCKSRKIKWDKIMKQVIEQIVRTCAL